MSETHALPEYYDGSGLYEIRLKGHLDDRWAEWFEGLTITLADNSETLVTGPVADQAAHILLRIGHRRPVRGVIDPILPAPQLVQAGHVRRHVAIGWDDHRRRPAHDMVAGEQNPLAGKGEAEMVGGVAGRGDRLERPAVAPDPAAVAEREEVLGPLRLGGPPESNEARVFRNSWRCGSSLSASSRAWLNLAGSGIAGQGICVTDTTRPSSIRASFRLAPPKSHPKDASIRPSFAKTIFQVMMERSIGRHGAMTLHSEVSVNHASGAFAVIPVLDLKDGVVVHARAGKQAHAGKRAEYRPIATPFGPPHDAAALVRFRREAATLAKDAVKQRVIRARPRSAAGKHNLVVVER